MVPKFFLSRPSEKSIMLKWEFRITEIRGAFRGNSRHPDFASRVLLKKWSKMKLFLIALFVLGSMFGIAGYGAKQRSQEIAYWIAAIIIWVALSILANKLL